MKKILALAVLLSTFNLAFADDMFNKDTLLIDTPTADVLDHYSASFNTRFYSQGSVMESFDFGVYPGLNIGFAVAAQSLIGDELPIRVLVPNFFLKYKIYDGSLYLPAIAIGYDGRKYGYDRVSEEYKYDEKGGYLTLSREVFVPNLVINAGINVSDFDNSDIFFFTGMSINIEDKVKLMGEWDNVHTVKDSRVNAGARIYLTDYVAVDLACRDLTQKDFERIVQIKYTTSF